MANSCSAQSTYINLEEVPTYLITIPTSKSDARTPAGIAYRYRYRHSECCCLAVSHRTTSKKFRRLLKLQLVERYIYTLAAEACKDAVRGHRQRYIPESRMTEECLGRFPWTSFNAHSVKYTQIYIHEKSKHVFVHREI